MSKCDRSPKWLCQFKILKNIFICLQNFNIARISFNFNCSENLQFHTVQFKAQVQVQAQVQAQVQVQTQIPLRFHIKTRPLPVLNTLLLNCCWPSKLRALPPNANSQAEQMRASIVNLFRFLRKTMKKSPIPIHQFQIRPIK